MVTSEQKERNQEIQDVESVEDLYDETPEAGVNGLYGLELNDGLTELEMLIAPRYALLSRGVMIVHGNPGCGKGVFGAYIAWKLRRFFKDKKVLLDYKPRRVFDYSYDANRYTLFDADFMMREIGKMAAKVDGKKVEADEKLEGDELKSFDKLAKDWRLKNEIMFMNAIWEMDELKRYLHNRNPHNRLGKMSSNVVSVWRHLGLLCLGMCPNIREIDVNGFLQYVTHEVKPEWCATRKDTTICRIRRKSHVGTDGVIKFESKPYALFIDGGKPRPEIGVQLMRPDFPLGVPEKRIIDVLQSKEGFANLNEISDATDEEINECRNRIISMNGKWIEDEPTHYNFNASIQCKNIFSLYNSKDLKNLNPKLNRNEE